jgi:geranylgeranyl diphosphate synthase type I
MLNQSRKADLDELYSMLAYQLGWEGEGSGPEARGKRIRSALVLLTASAAGGEWECALPAAAAVELVHNFSLIHDDIQDNSSLRRGRPTVWVKWGVAQAINAGDAMFTLAHLAVLKLQNTVSSVVALQSARILQETCLALTQGQFLDLAYEARGDLTIEAYWPMVEGKTAALLAACTYLGALAAQAEPARSEAYRQFGRALGLAFQAQDDLLGIWGDESLMGKSKESDLISGKKSLPVLYGLQQGGPFAERWNRGAITPEEISGLSTQLENEGGRIYTQDKVNDLTDQALRALETAQPLGDAGEALFTLAKKLMRRDM